MGTSVALNPDALNKAQLMTLFDLLSEKLKQRKTSARIYVVGGACMALAYDRGRTTNDVDGRFDIGHGALVAAAKELADQYGLGEKWLNEQALNAIPRAPDTRAKVFYESESLVVTGAGPEHLLAMKLEAGREKDMADIGFLLQTLDITKADEAVHIHERTLPFSARKAQVRALLAGLAQYKSAKLSPPTLPQQEGRWLQTLMSSGWPRFQRVMEPKGVRVCVETAPGEGQKSLGAEFASLGVAAAAEAHHRQWPSEAVAVIKGFVAAELSAHSDREGAGQHSLAQTAHTQQRVQEGDDDAEKTHTSQH